jgi:RNA polymerase sigma-70 factor, ECF subfamily
VQERIIPDVDSSDLPSTFAAAHQRQLIERAADGDREAFAQLVETRLERTFRTAAAILGNEADARDATQEAFLSAWTNLPRLRDAASFDAWLGRVLANKCRDLLRRRHRSREIAFEDLSETGQTDAGLSTSALNAAFEALSVEHRYLIVLHHLHHEPVAAIAERLGIPEGTAKWRLYQARQALERALEVEA